MKFAALKRTTLNAQRALYARLPFISEKMDDKQALTVMESCRPNMTKLPSPSTMRRTGIQCRSIRRAVPSIRDSSNYFLFIRNHHSG